MREDDFWERVAVLQDNNACWPYLGPTQKDGYGVAGKNLAHRLSFKFHNGHEALNNVCHTCNNPICCNPFHLYDGTQKQNVADAIRVHGHWHRQARAILSVDERLTIIRRYNSGEAPKDIFVDYPHMSIAGLRHVIARRHLYV